MGLEISNTVIRIADLIAFTDPPILDGIEATNVVFVGPAVLAVMEGTLEFKGDTTTDAFEGMFWPLEEGRQRVSGAIGLRNSKFTNCTFQKIGFAVDSKHAHQFVSMLRAN